MRNGFIWILVALLTALFACESNEAGGIRLHYSWTDTEGNDITPPDLTLLHTWGELTYAKETKTAGPAWLGDPDDTLRFENLPYGIAMTLELTIRAAEDPAHKDLAPDERPDNVAYYCTSQEFKLVRGKVTDVENGCVMQKGPAAEEGGTPSVRVFLPDGTTELAVGGVLREEDAEVLLRFKAEYATQAVIGNETGFKAASTRTLTLAELKSLAEEPGYGAGWYETAWDINYGRTLESEPTDRAQRVIYLKTNNSVGYESKPASFEIFIDNKSPFIVNRVLDPQKANGGRPITLSLSFHEPVQDVQLSASHATLSAAVFSFSLNEELSNEQVLVFEHSIDSNGDDAEGDYVLTVVAVDNVGNELSAELTDILTIDKTPPEVTVTGCSVRTRRDIVYTDTFSGEPLSIAAAKEGDVVEVTLELVIEDNIDVGLAPLLTLGGELMVEECETPGAFCWAQTVIHSNTNPEGNKRVVVEAVDSAGNLYSETVLPVIGGIDKDTCRAIFDFTGPILTSASLRRDPDFLPAYDHAGKILHFSLTDPLTDGAVTAQLNLYADEELDVGTVTVAGLDFGAAAEVTGNFAQFERLLDAGLAEGEYAFMVTWSDLLGNESTQPVDWKMLLDKTAPDAALVDMKKVLYTRKPWGTDDTAGKPKFSVAGETGAVTSADIATLIAYNELGSIIGQTSVTGGAFDIPALTGGDLPNIYLNPVKKSGMKATGTGALVTEISWHATMGGKVPGSTFENPHTFITTGMIDQVLEQKGVLLQEPMGGGQGEIVRAGNDSWDKWNDHGEEPVGQEGAAMAYDSARGRMLLFGGFNGSATTNETWEWDGTAWTQLNPVTRPSARSGHAMAYDSARGKVVLFGGAVESSNDETWEWSGTNWTQMYPTNNPSARKGHAMAYDSVRGKVVLFGGGEYYDGYFHDYQDTWEWDGANWAQIIPTNKPAALSGHAMAYDDIRGKVILFGGTSFYDNASHTNQETWGWDGVDWLQVKGSAGTTCAGSCVCTIDTCPSARRGHAMAYDSSREKVLLFGGSEATEGAWEWDGMNWTQLNSVIKPSARYSPAMAYDRARKKVMMFGGVYAGSNKNETWEWDGTNWKQKNPATKPSARNDHAMIYDSGRNKVVLFGGEGLNDTWEWDGTNWMQINPTNEPSALSGHALAYDSVREKTVLFGGVDAQTWEWDGTNWTQKNPANKPSARSGHAMAYDRTRSKVVLFGGSNGASSNNETWVWDGTNWIQMNPVDKPSVRTGHAMLFGNIHEKIILFGGSDGLYYDDTWEWDGTNWTQMNPASKPDGRSAHAMTYDSSRAQALLYGGFTGAVFSDETWEWGDNRWKQKNTGNKPPVLMNHAITYDVARSRTVLFGGMSEINTYDETWLFNGGGTDRPGQIMNVAWENAGIVDDDSIRSVSVFFNAGGLGDYTGTPTNGVDLLTWKHDRWVSVSSNTADPDNLAPVTWETTDPVEIRTLLNSGLRKFNFAVVPTAPNGFLSDMGTIATDYAEVIVRYTTHE